MTAPPVPKLRISLKSEAMLLVCTLIWGGTFLATDIALAYASPMALISARFGLAAMLALALDLRAIVKMSRAAMIRGLILGALLYSSFGMQTIGQAYTSVSRSAFITQLLVAFTPVLERVLFRRRARPATLAGVCIVLFGMCTCFPEPASDSAGIAATGSRSAARSFSASTFWPSTIWICRVNTRRSFSCRPLWWAFWAPLRHS
ncbi:MAG: DMT family transporter [Spirochaetales bacterium]|nr:DMT family transporter [Spirochaetales bacterium]